MASNINQHIFQLIVKDNVSFIVTAHNTTATPAGFNRYRMFNITRIHPGANISNLIKGDFFLT